MNVQSTNSPMPLKSLAQLFSFPNVTFPYPTKNSIFIQKTRKQQIIGILFEQVINMLIVETTLVFTLQRFNNKFSAFQTSILVLTAIYLQWFNNFWKSHKFATLQMFSVSNYRPFSARRPFFRLAIYICYKNGLLYPVETYSYHHFGARK